MSEKKRGLNDWKFGEFELYPIGDNSKLLGYNLYVNLQKTTPSSEELGVFDLIYLTMKLFST